MSPASFARCLRAVWTCALLLALGCAGAAPRWSLLTETGFQHLTPDQGLPNEITTSVVEDAPGFLWVATHGGLARWDGYRFQVWRADPLDPTALPDNLLQVLHTDRAGTLWIGTHGAGLVRYDRASDRFKTLSPGRTGLSHANVHALVSEGDGALWVATEGGLDLVDTGTLGVRRGIGKVAGMRVNALLIDRAGALWVGTEQGLLRRAAGTQEFQPVPWPALAGGGTPEPLALRQDGAGRLWIGTERHGAWIIDSDGAAPQPVADGAAPGLAGQSVVGIVETRPGEVWLATASDGIVAVETSTMQARRIRHRATVGHSLAADAVQALFRDRSGLVWAATQRGLSRHDPRQMAVLTMVGPPRGDAGPELAVPAGSEVSAILPLPDGRLWLGTHRHGIDIVDPENARVGGIRPDAARPQAALPESPVLALARGADGRAVYAATRGGLYRIAGDGTRVERIAVGTRDPAAATSALLQGEDGGLWLGGQSDGLWRLDEATGRGQRYPRTGATSLSDERVTALARADAGRLWVGTRFGLNRLDPSNGLVTPVVPEPGRADGLAAGAITALLTDRQNRLWVGTYGGGLHRMDGWGADGQARFSRVGLAQGLPDDNVGAVVEDAQGRIWVSTDGGFAVVDPGNLAVQAYRRAEGVVFSSLWSGAAARSAEGEVLFGGAGGLTIVRPTLLQAWGYQPPVVVTGVRLGNQRLPAPAAGGTLEVPYGTSGVAVEFAALDYSAPARLRYAYRLDGVDSDWIEVDALHRVAAYTNLPPGDYTLQLRGSNRDGAWSPHQAALALKVLPQWYQAGWVRIGAGVAALLLVLAFVQWRTGRLGSVSVDLERKVRERTIELETVTAALHEKTRVLEETSVSDPLTGLRNRRFLTQNLEPQLAASLRRAIDGAGANDTDMVFLMVDIDHFKRINEQFGQPAGDAVLVQVGQRLQQALRESDYVVRWGGEEFLAVARDTDRSRAEELAERIRLMVRSQPFDLDGGRLVNLTCSIGFTCAPFLPHEPRSVGWADAVRLADIALVAAKRAGRDGWVGLAAGPAAHADGLRQCVEGDAAAMVDARVLVVRASRPLDVVLEAF